LSKTPQKPTVIRAIDLFCGAGGSSWGAQKAGVEIVAAFDSWELAGKNKTITSISPMCGSIRRASKT